MLHYRCHHGDDHNHKLELVDTGAMTLPEMKQEIQQVFCVNPNELSIMRLDLAVDIAGVGVSWFAERTRVRFKRWISKLGVIEIVEMGDRKIQTLYYGKRPNVIRIYNKLDEYQGQYQKMLKGVPPELTPPTFEECFGVPQTGHVLTRVERQMGGGRIPSALATVADLENCTTFNPFESLEFTTYRRPYDSIFERAKNQEWSALEDDFRTFLLAQGGSEVVFQQLTA